jgi:hypothetical protein
MDLSTPLTGRLKMRKFFITASVAIAAAAALFTWPAVTLAGEEIVASGSFKGASSHVTNGNVTIRKTADGVVVVLEEDFDFDGAPDPKLGFGKDGKYDHGSQISHLGSNKGRQVYEVPASIDPEAYNEFYVWCEKYNVPLGVANLK